MQEITQSLNTVLSTSGFLYTMSMIIVIGILVGVKLNEFFVGFKRSIVILIPFVFVLLLTNFIRILEITNGSPIGHNAYNGSISIFITTICYVVGLFLGHVTFHKAKEDAQKELNDINTIH